LQQTSVDVHSLSAWQSRKPFVACWQLFCALDAKLVATHACPIAESQVVSVAQNWGQSVPFLHTLPADP
jgi:hypothetical protein